MSNKNPNFRYLNLENHWLGLNGNKNGCEVRQDGALVLSSLPVVESTIIEKLEFLTATSIVGLAVAEKGEIFFSDIVNHAIFYYENCGKTINFLPCFGGKGFLPGQLNSPHGILIDSNNLLYIADTGNHRIQVADLDSMQIISVWGQQDDYNNPKTSDISGRFDSPIALVADLTGYIYVLETGNNRIQKFSSSGTVDPSFWNTLQVLLPDGITPIAFDFACIDETEYLFFLDHATSQIYVCSITGELDDVLTSRWRNLLPDNLQGVNASSLKIAEETLYIGDKSGKGIFAFDLKGQPRGFVRDLNDAITALTHDRDNKLLAVVAKGNSVIKISSQGGYVRKGTFLFGPVSIKESTQWHRVSASLDELKQDDHYQLYTLTSNRFDEHTSPDFPASNEQNSTTDQVGVNLTKLDKWRALPIDLYHGLILNQPGRYLWLAGILEGKGESSPILHQIRLEFDHQGWMQFLPGIYQDGTDSSVFLQRMLYLLESSLGEISAKIDSISSYCDPSSSPDKGTISWLDWLAGWLDLELLENWTEEHRRKIVGNAYDLYGRRGTVEAILEQLGQYGVNAHILEPARQIALWSLDENSILGFTTVTVPAKSEGATLGNAAILGQTILKSPSEMEVSLFEELAYRFDVFIYASDLAEYNSKELIIDLLDQEKPAYMDYVLHIIDAQMRVGFQARIGIDSIVAGSPEKILVGDHPLLGINSYIVNKTH